VKLFWIACATSAGLLIAGCGATDESNSSANSTTSESADNPLATYVLEGEGGDGALLAATLELESNECLYGITEDGERWFLAFPENATWDSASREVDIDGVRATVDEEVQLSGGETSGDLDPDDFYVVKPQAFCSTDSTWQVTAIVQ
jgi:hypothetical protein